MTIQTTYSDARARFAKLLDEVADNREVVIIRRRGHEDVALIAADDLSSMMETLHVLGSPANAERLAGGAMRLTAIVLTLGLLAGPTDGQAQAALVVTTTADDVDVMPGDGLCATAAGGCSLRAAGSQ